MGNFFIFLGGGGGGGGVVFCARVPCLDSSDKVLVTAAPGPHACPPLPVLCSCVSKIKFEKQFLKIILFIFQSFKKQTIR